MAKQPKPETTPQDTVADATAVPDAQTSQTDQTPSVMDAKGAVPEAGAAAVTPAKPKSEHRLATATRLIDHNGTPVEVGGDILLTETEFKALAAVGAVAETHWDDLDED